MMQAGGGLTADRLKPESKSAQPHSMPHVPIIRTAFRIPDDPPPRVRAGLVGVMFWIRLFESLKVSNSLGPLVLTLGEILHRDVGRFLVVLSILMLGFGSAIMCAARPYPDRIWR